MGAHEASGEGELRAQDLGVGSRAELGAVIPVLTSVATIASLVAYTASNEAIPCTTFIAWALVLGAWGIAPFVRRKHGEREATRFALATLGIAPALFALATVMLWWPIVVRTPSGDDIRSEFYFGVLPVLAAAVAPAIGTSLSSAAPAARAQGLRCLAWCVALAVALLCSSALRRAEHAPPSTELQISGTEVARLCPVTTACPTRVDEGPRTAGRFVVGPRVVDELVVRGVRVERVCTGTICRVRMVRDEGRSVAGHAELRYDNSVGFFQGSSELVVRHNERRGGWLIEDPSNSDRELRWRAFDANLRPTSLSVGDFARDYSAPRGWLYGAIAGVLFSAALLLWPARKFRGPLPEACVEGHYDGAGTLLVNGVAVGTLREQGWVFTKGPVLWVRSEHSSEAPYRATLPLDGVRAGTLAELRFAHAAPGIARSLFALTVLALTSAPLFAAALAGLVF